MIKSTIILEILGRPPEHLEETLKEIIEKLGKEKGVEIITYRINKPKEIENQKGFYTTFSEVEIEASTISHIAMIVFKYMPSHIEIEYPEKIILKNNEISEVFSEITRRLHRYDEVARVIQFEKDILEKKLREILETQKQIPKKPVKKKTAKKKRAKKKKS